MHSTPDIITIDAMPLPVEVQEAAAALLARLGRKFDREAWRERESQLRRAAETIAYYAYMLRHIRAQGAVLPPEEVYVVENAERLLGMILLAPSSWVVDLCVYEGMSFGGRRFPQVESISPTERISVALCRCVGWMDDHARALTRARGRHVAEDRREAALDRLARRIGWRIYDEAVEQALAARAQRVGMSWATLKHQELRAALVQVLGERLDAQEHRFGTSWYKGEDGHKAKFIPLTLTWENPGHFQKWLKDEVIKAAVASLLDRPYPPTGEDAFDEGDWGAGATDLSALPDGADCDPLHTLLAAADAREARDDLHKLLAHANPADRELLSVLREQLQDRQVPDLAEAARALERKPGAVRTRWCRYRRQMKMAL